MSASISHSTLSAANQSSLTLTYLPIVDLKPDPRNARTHSKKQVQQIAKSIESFGFNVPILIDAACNVVAGHGRLLAAKKLGWTEVPTIRLDHLTETQRRAFMIADNRLTEIGAWDDRLLAEQLKELSTVDLTFDIEATGFDAPQIDLMIASLTVNVEAAADEKPLPCVSGPPVTRMGDLWTLGRHKVLCGDATDAASFANLIGSEEVAVVFTDPPYNVPINGHVSGLGGLRHREFSMAAGELSPSEFTGFLETALGFCARHSRSGALVYACMDWRHIEELQGAARASGLEMVNLCVWAKPNAGMGSFYRSQHELVFVFKNGPGSHVWSYANGPGFGRAGEEGRLAALHPTVKPVPMIADALLDSSQHGDIALDPFLGSGATLMAAERTGRRCFGLELDPLYVDVIVRRWQAYTGDVARCLATGATFDETETARTAVAEQVAT